MKKYKAPYRRKIKRQFYKSRLLWASLVFLGVVGFVFYGLFLSPLFQLKEVVVQGSERVPAQELQSMVADAASHIFFVRTGELEERMREQFPEIRSVALAVDLPGTVRVEVVERSVVAAWCTEVQCFAVDSEGVAFEEAEESGEYAFKVFTPAQGGVTKEQLTLLLRFQEMVPKIEASSFTIVSEDRIVAKTAREWEVYLTAKEDLQWQATKLEAVLEKKILAEEREGLEYIDLRFGDQAYIKRR